MDANTAPCEGCGKPLDSGEEPRDLAHVSDPRHYCPLCRLLYCPAPTPTMPSSASRRSPGPERRAG